MKNKSFKDCIVIGINYNSTNEVICWAKSLIRQDNYGENILIIVVDNSNEIDDSLVDSLRKIDERIIYIKSNQNLGYLGGARFGYDYVRLHNFKFDFLIVCNVDIIFQSNNLFTCIKSNLNKNIGVISPSIIDHSGFNINPYKVKRVNRLYLHLMKFYYKYSFFHNIITYFRIWMQFKLPSFSIW